MRRHQQQCRRTGPNERVPIVSVIAATAIVGNNRVQGMATLSAQVNVTRISSGSGGVATPAATIVGNLVSSPIILNNAALLVV